MFYLYLQVLLESLCSVCDGKMLSFTDGERLSMRTFLSVLIYVSLCSQLHFDSETDTFVIVSVTWLAVLVHF